MKHITLNRTETHVVTTHYIFVVDDDFNADNKDIEDLAQELHDTVGANEVYTDFHQCIDADEYQLAENHLD